MSEQRNCGISTGEISPGSERASQCIEKMIGRFMDNEVEVADVIQAGTLVTEDTMENGTHNACVSCDACNRRVNVGVMPAGMRISVSTIPKDVLPIAKRVFGR